MEQKDNTVQQEWLMNFRNGNESALSYFFKLHSKPLLYFTSRIISDEIEAEDIVADCFYKLWERRTEFQTAQNIKAFLYISARNACLNHLRSVKRETATQQRYYKQLEESEENILYKIIESEFMEILNSEIELLPKKCREVFKLLYFEGKKTDEIAITLELSVKTVRNRKAIAVELLRTSFLKKGISDALYLAFLVYLNNR